MLQGPTPKASTLTPDLFQAQLVQSRKVIEHKLTDGYSFVQVEDWLSWKHYMLQCHVLLWEQSSKYHFKTQTIEMNIL